MMRRRVLTLLVAIGVSLAVVSPVEAVRRIEIELILLVDTSDSMDDELRALCQGLEGVADDMARFGITVEPMVMGIAETRACVEEEVSRVTPEGRVVGKEDWGVALADLARFHEWKAGVVRLIIPMSDEGPLGGDPVSDEDERAIQMAIQVALANDVMVSPVLSSESSPELVLLARKLAQETYGDVFVLDDSGDDLSDGLCDLIMAAAERAREGGTVVESIPIFRDVSFDGHVIRANLMLAFLIVLVLSVASAVLDDTLSANQEAFLVTRLGRLVAVVIKGTRITDRILAPGEWSRSSVQSRRLVVVLQFGLSLVVVSFLGVFLQPGLSPASWQGLGLWLGLLSAITLVSLIYEGMQYWIAWWVGVAPTIRLRPAAPVLTLGTVILSRVVGLLPGFLFGKVTNCELPSEGSRTDAQIRQRARTALGGIGVISMVGLSLWTFTLPVSLLLDWIDSQSLPTILTDFTMVFGGAVQGFLRLCFFVTLQIVLFELLPYPSTGGGIIFQRNRLIWALLVFAAIFVLLHSLINPFGATEELLHNSGLLLLLFFTFVYSVFSVSVWLGFALQTSVQAAGWEQEQHTTVLAISLIVIWVLGACVGLVTFLVGLLR